MTQTRPAPRDDFSLVSSAELAEILGHTDADAFNAWRRRNAARVGFPPPIRRGRWQWGRVRLWLARQTGEDMWQPAPCPADGRAVSSPVNEDERALIAQIGQSIGKG